MVFSDQDLKYLKGEAFSNRYELPLLPKTGELSAPLGRQEWLANFVVGKAVLHIGCTDHIPLIDDKRAKGIWLHDILTARATTCVGIDIDEEAVKYVRMLGVENVIAGDITETVPNTVSSQLWDVAILGELIEHIDNPVQFLSAVRKNIGTVVNQIVITTPNAFRYVNIAKTKEGVEFINSDHRYWFTPFTLAKVCSLSGWVPIELTFVEHGAMKRRRRRLLSRHPQFCDTLVLVANSHPT